MEESVKDRINHIKVFERSKSALRQSLSGKNLKALHVVLDGLSSLHLTEGEVEDLLASLSQLNVSFVNKLIECEFVDTLYAWVFGLNVKNGWTFEVIETWLSMHQWVLHGAKVKYLAN